MKKQLMMLKNKKLIFKQLLQMTLWGAYNIINKCHPELNFVSDFKVQKKKKEKYKALVKKQQLQLITMHTKLKALRFSNRMLKSYINNDKYKKVVNAIYNPDQVRALLKRNHIQNWSNETILRAL